MITKREDWKIQQFCKWVATYIPTGHVIVADCEATLMRYINEYERELENV